MPQLIEDKETEQEAAAKQPKKVTEDFFSSLKGYTPAEWERQLMLKLFRTAPQIDMGLKGAKEFYIERYTEPIDEDRVKRDQGSGGYLLRLYRTPPGKKDQIADQYYFTIFDPGYPPKSPRTLWTDAAANKKWVEGFPNTPTDKTNGPAVQGLTTADVLQIVDRVTERLKPPPEQKDALQSALIEALQAGHKSSIDMILKQVDAQSPDKVVAMVTALKGLVQAEKPVVESPLALVTGVINLIKGLQPAAPEGVPGLGQLKEVIGVMKDARELFGVVEGGGAGPGGKWDFWGNVIREVVPAARDIIHDGVAAWQQSLFLKAGVQPAQFTASPPAPAARAAAVPAAALPAPAVVAAEAAASQGAPSAPDQRLQVLQAVAVGFMNHLSSSGSGEEFAEWVESGYGQLAYEQLKSFGAEGLLNVLKSSPFWGQLSSIESKVQAFIAEFMNWDKEAWYQEEPDLASPVPGSPKKAGRK